MTRLQRLLQALTIAASMFAFAPPAAHAAPILTTNAATGITATGATLNSTVDDNGSNTTTSFDYGLTAIYGSNVAATTGGTITAGNGATAVAVTLTGLACATTYHFRGRAQNIGGTTLGGDLAFTTSACPTYTVTYSGNTNTGGSVPIDASNYLTGATVTVLGNTGTLVKTGNTFAGWNTAANGSGTSRAPGSTFAMGGANIILYAQWTLSPVNGVCGTSNGVSSPFAPSANLCTTGAASGVTSSAGSYGWTCAGTNGGTTPACSAPWQTTGSNSGTGSATVSTNGWVSAALGNGPLQSAGFIATGGHPKSPPTVPQGVTFPHGLFDFVLTGGAPGSSAVVTITYPGAVPAGAVYWKYGPTPAGNNCGSPAVCALPHWYQFPAVFAGNTATLTITDGGLGDDDLTANGVIVDQGGPGVPALEIPTLSEWARILLALLLVVAGLGAMQRRRSP
ncbi:hypothetical protein BH11PSE11_BH11PSE11_36100 [soil metagenome]